MKHLPSQAVHIWRRSLLTMGLGHMTKALDEQGLTGVTELVRLELSLI
jgi:hypothetical protein